MPAEKTQAPYMNTWNFALNYVPGVMSGVSVTLMRLKETILYRFFEVILTGHPIGNSMFSKLSGEIIHNLIEIR